MNKKDLFIAFAVIIVIAIIVISLFLPKEQPKNNQSALTEKEIVSTEGSSNELPSSLITTESNEGYSVGGNTIDGGYAYTEENLKLAKVNALRFIEIILPYEESAPLKNIQPTKELLQITYSETLGLISNAIKEKNEPNIYLVKDVLKRNLKRLEVVENEFYHPNEMFINISAITDTTYTNGTTVEEEYFYNVFLEKNLDGIYKVSSIFRFE